MGVFLTILGVVVIVAGLMDMFHTLLHPSGQGRLSLDPPMSMLGTGT